MAKQTITRLIDDLDETEAHQTVQFGLDGVQYEIDLSDANAAALRGELQRFLTAGRKLGKVKVASNGQPHAVMPTGKGRNTTVAREQSRAMRGWVKRNWRAAGLEEPTSDKGRISRDAVHAYHAAGGLDLQVDPAKAAGGSRERLDAAKAPAFSDQSEANGASTTVDRAELRKMPVGELRKLAHERGWSTLAKAGKPAIIEALVVNPDGPPAVKAQAKGKTAKPAKAATKPAEKPAEANGAPDLSRYTPAERKELNERVRAWAKDHKGKVNDKGRISPQVYAAYDAQDPALLPK